MIYQSNYACHSPQYIPIIPFTAQELKSMFGWTVEEALRRGFPVVSYDIPRELRGQKKPPQKLALLWRKEKILQLDDNTILEESQSKK